MTFSAAVLTLYPEMFPGPLGHSLAGRALKEGIWSLSAVNIRDFATDKHRTVDDTPYGGGAGMVMKPDVVNAAILHARKESPQGQLVYFTPRGRVFTQKLAQELVKHYSTPLRGDTQKSSLILLCGHFEGIDERVIEAHQPLEISLGDFVLSGGEMAALTVLDACVRLLPGVMGASGSLEEESFGPTGMLEYPHYTRPPLWEGRAVPEVLLSGDHAKIHAWRQEQARLATRQRRPDLLPAPKKTQG